MHLGDYGERLGGSPRFRGGRMQIGMRGLDVREATAVAIHTAASLLETSTKFGPILEGNTYSSL